MHWIRRSCWGVDDRWMAPSQSMRGRGSGGAAPRGRAGTGKPPPSGGSGAAKKSSTLNPGNSRPGAVTTSASGAPPKVVKPGQVRPRAPRRASRLPLSPPRGVKRSAASRAQGKVRDCSTLDTETCDIYTILHGAPPLWSRCPSNVLRRAVGGDARTVSQLSPREVRGARFTWHDDTTRDVMRRAARSSARWMAILWRYPTNLPPRWIYGHERTLPCARGRDVATRIALARPSPIIHHPAATRSYH